MNSGIFLIQEDGTLVEMSEKSYDSEELLQKLLAQYPSLLAGGQIDSEDPRRWLLVCREASLASEEGGSDRWSVDHLFLDQDGIPTLVEVKRSSDTRIRREVVGQMLDYAANAVLHWPVEEIRAKLAARCENIGEEAAVVLEEFLAGAMEAEQFWTQVKTNLQAGKIRMLLVADEIPNELRRIVEFLNQQMEFAEVLALEIKQFAGQGLTTLVPRVMGQTAESERVKSRGDRVRRDWDEASYLKDLGERAGSDAVQLARRILEIAKPKVDRISYGHGQTPVMIPLVELQGRGCGAFRLASNGRFRVLFYLLARVAPFVAPESRLELLRRMNEIPGVNLSPESIDGMPWVNREAIQTERGFCQFAEVFDWVIQKLRNPSAKVL